MTETRTISADLLRRILDDTPEAGIDDDLVDELRQVLGPRPKFMVGFGHNDGIHWDEVEEYLTGDEIKVRDAMRADPDKYWHAVHPMFLTLERLSYVRRALAAKEDPS